MNKDNVKDFLAGVEQNALRRRMKEEIPEALNRGLHPITPLGAHMLMQDFLDDVENGGFIDYDGHGYLATATHESWIKVRPSTIVTVLDQLIKDQNDSFTHVVWYNR